MDQDQRTPLPVNLSSGAGGWAAGGDWPWWMAPAALFGAFVLANLAALVVDLPLVVAFGVKISSKHTPPGIELAGTAVQDFVFVGTAVWLASTRSRRPFSWEFGLRPTSFGRALGWLFNVLIGYLLFSLIWVQLVGSPREEVLESLGANQGAALLVLSALLTCVIAPICEEFLFRGFIFRALCNWRGPWPAAILTGLMFGAVHLGSAPTVDLVPLAALGFGLCILRWRTGSLYPCIAAHALNNSIAYGSQEGWLWWQVITLLCAAMALIWLLAFSLKRLGVISPLPQTITEA
ncbi:MAG: CPBP family glutamic-type intramembrane protease [Solirubrobacteraceae bacterium]